MIELKDKLLCCGCYSCVQRCPRQCITMTQDEEGFFYPHVDHTTCINCGLCEKVCPTLLPRQEHNVINTFAAKNHNEVIRKESSSGGIFTILAETIINEGGVVFGASWDQDNSVEHSYSESIDGLKAFRSSKYVQSNIKNSYKQVEVFLKSGRKVLFSGTPCQVAGLKAFLRSEYDNLIMVECVCHGVPSPGLWQKYLSEVSNGRTVIEINHRDKHTGWENYSVVIKFSDGSEIAQAHDENPWTRAFIKNITLRPSCYSCAYKGVNSVADITIGDLWGADKLLPEQHDNLGHTLVIIHTIKARDMVRNVECVKNFQMPEVAHYNSALCLNSKYNDKRGVFFTMIYGGKPFINVVKSLTKDPLLLKIKLLIRKFI